MSSHALSHPLTHPPTPSTHPPPQVNLDPQEVVRQLKQYLRVHSSGPLKPDVCAALGTGALARALRASPAELSAKLQRYLQVGEEGAAEGGGDLRIAAGAPGSGLGRAAAAPAALPVRPPARPPSQPPAAPAQGGGSARRGRPSRRSSAAAAASAAGGRRCGGLGAAARVQQHGARQGPQ
jgi:hypothetical protein